MHGTGTLVGDLPEMSAVGNVFKHRRRADGPLPVGTVKASFGHSGGAAGMASLLKRIMATCSQSQLSITEKKIGGISTKSTVQTQLAVLTLEIGLAAFWKVAGVQLVMGHSLGEYAALHVAGVLSLADMLFLPTSRPRCPFTELTRRIFTARLGSLQMLAARHVVVSPLQQEGLFKKPSKWTYRHVELFCSFEDPLPAPALQDKQLEKGSGARYVNGLLKRDNIRWRTTMMRKLLEHPNHTFENTARFYFDGRCVETFDCLIVCHDTGPTITAYFDGGSLSPVHYRPFNQSLQLPHPRILALLVTVAYRQSEQDGIRRCSSNPRILHLLVPEQTKTNTGNDGKHSDARMGTGAPLENNPKQ
ncbi:non-reducing polyketide synthase [Metarhizium rileyi]|uniref:Non-reducing polyketide synthase n=1 Tax=Metarhizium rileyi (strain RCEF 4871) TaxID=1649241 RepID=A0A167KQ35_METRR|nr:non-reducing polyketide synthase [Metarhizium rileyi RCEF 4871]